MTRAVFVLFLFLSAAATTGARQAGGGPGEWTGTITVEEHAAGTLRGGNTYIGFEGRRSVTYTLNGDGTASWSGSFNATTDMGGFYSIPATGGGGGFGHAGASFEGGGWTVYANSDDEMSTLEDHTAEDKAQATYGVAALAKEIAKAMGEPMPPIPPRVDHGHIGALSALVPVAGAGNVASLSSSTSEVVQGGADRLGGPGTIPSTIDYSWNLTRTPVPPHVKIYGEECGCLEPDATEKTMHFVAGAAPTGGEFSEFIVTANGKMSEIVSNTGGRQPSLEIVGTKDTGTVTLKIRYTRNGVTQESAPFTVDFCDIEKVEVKDNDTDLAFDFVGRLIVEAKSRMWRGGKDVSSELEWDIDKMGGPTSLEAAPSTKKGDHIKFTYRELPQSNSDFGKKKLTAKSSGKCACRREQTIRAFYDPNDSDHPDDQTPNWFYYWKQTSAVPAGVRGRVRYRAVLVDDTQTGEVIGQFNGLTDLIYIAKALHDAKACKDEVMRGTETPTGRHAQGIDCMGEIVKHEEQHRTDAIDWWGSPAGPDGLYDHALISDADGDHLPTAWEARLPGCSSFSKRSCNDRPFRIVTDTEINAYWEGWKWPIGSANAEDWSCGPLGKQWQGKKCGP